MISTWRKWSTGLFLLALLTACGNTPSPTPAPVSPSIPTPAPTIEVTDTPTTTPIPSGERIIQFSGYEWTVRDSSLSGPGPNLWSGRNVWVDENGDLHLLITHDEDGWHCAEVTLTQSLSFGRYQFQVIGPIDHLDPNVVLGLFNYPPEEVRPDGTNEIDIEFAHWGDPANPIGNYTVWPSQTGLEPTGSSFPVALNGTYTTQRFTWTSDTIHYQSMHGHRDDDENEFANWSFQPADFAARIPQQPLPVHINLWLFEGQPPSDGQEVEIIIQSFTFTPQE